jgi:proteasome accessory factor B
VPRTKKTPSVSRIERLLNLTAALLNTERALSAEELHERVPGYPDDKGSFRRQFERDKDALRQLGLPLTTSPLTGEYAEFQTGYQIVAAQYYLPDPGLAPDELSALHLAARVVRLEGNGTADASWKLGRPDAGGNAFGGDGGAALDAVIPVSDGLAVLFGAIAERRLATFTYKSETRTVEPNQLSFRTGHWYLLAFDRLRLDHRSFRIDRIESTVDLGEQIDAAVAAVPQNRAPQQPWELGTGQPTMARVRIDAAQAIWARANLGEAAIVARDDAGAVTFELAVRNRDAFRSFVLGFLDRATVVGPPEFRDDMINWLRHISTGTEPSAEKVLSYATDGAVQLNPTGNTGGGL